MDAPVVGGIIAKDSINVPGYRKTAMPVAMTYSELATGRFLSVAFFCFYWQRAWSCGTWKERESMPESDPRFWEIMLLPHRLDEFSEADAIRYETAEERELRYEEEESRRKIIPLIMDIIENDLTEMQRNCIELHFLRKRSQAEIAQALGISHRVVTQHIYGISRRGKRVGGGIKKIRKVCEKRGISL
ncbi:sigma factor-like helix-turn-helix DNA-binding protein [Candidatus Poribacteria bacterium]